MALEEPVSPAQDLVYEVASRTQIALRSHFARTMIDLTADASLKIVVASETYELLRIQAGETMGRSGRASYVGGVLRLHGIIVCPDSNLHELEIRLRTELPA